MTCRPPHIESVHKIASRPTGLGHRQDVDGQACISPASPFSPAAVPEITPPRLQNATRDQQGASPPPQAEAQDSISHFSHNQGSNAEPAKSTALRETLRHPDVSARLEASYELARRGDMSAVAILVEGMRHEERRVRMTCAEILASLGEIAIPAVLATLTRSPISGPLREAAFHALHDNLSAQNARLLEPLLDALLDSADRTKVSLIAQHLLTDWKGTG
jgi:hypothetical protein